MSLTEQSHKQLEGGYVTDIIPSTRRELYVTKDNKYEKISLTKYWESWFCWGSIRKWCMSIWKRMTKKSLNDLKADLRNMKWFREPVMPPGPWRTVYGFRPVPKRKLP